MRSDLIVFLLPSGNQHLGLRERGEDLAVQEFVSQFAVEGLYVPVLPGAARFDEQSLDAYPSQPIAYRLSGELGRSGYAPALPSREIGYRVG